MPATLISVCPFELNEPKPTCTPAEFHINAAQPDDFEILVIGKVWVDRYIQSPSGEGVNERFLEDSMVVANAIIRDFAQAQLVGIHNSDCQPGLCALEGEYTKAEILKNHKPKLDEARSRHKRFCIELVKLADDDWQKFRQHRMITDRQRQAALYLRLTRDWMIDPDEIMNIKCPYCKTSIAGDSIVCNNCTQVVDPVGMAAIKAKHAELVPQIKPQNQVK